MERKKSFTICFHKVKECLILILKDHQQKKKKSAGFEDFAEAIIESTLLLVGETKESST